MTSSSDHNSQAFPKILVVDDDADTLFTLELVLESNSFLVNAFTDPERALRDFKPNFYDALLIDIRMPKMNGFELFNKLRITDSDIRACFMTSFVAYYESLKEQFHDIDTQCFIQKPIDANNLVNHLMKQIISKE